MAKEGPNWDGLLKWSPFHSDGTLPNRLLRMIGDVIKRMKEITLAIQAPMEVLETIKHPPNIVRRLFFTDFVSWIDLLNELQEHVESIDIANDLHAIGGLVPLLGYLKNDHAGIRAKAGEAVATIVQNNPRSQQMVMDANGLEPLLSNFSSDINVVIRTKSLGVIYSLIRHNEPGVAAFRLANGYASLKEALNSDNVKFQR